jgi:hypothetical protein
MPNRFQNWDTQCLDLLVSIRTCGFLGYTFSAGISGIVAAGFAHPSGNRCRRSLRRQDCAASGLMHRQPMLFHAEIGQPIGSAQCSASLQKKRHQQRGLERGAERNHGRIGTPMYARSLSRLFEYSIAFLGKAVLILVRRTYSGRWSGRRGSGRSHSALVLQILSRPALQPAKPVDIANGCPDSARADDVPIPKNSFPNISVSDGIFSTIPLLEHQFCNQYFTHPIRIVIYNCGPIEVGEDE